MKTFFLTFLGGLSALIVFFVLLPIALVLSFMPSDQPAPTKNAVIAIDLREVYPDQPATDDVSALFAPLSFVEVLLRLNAAAEDPNVKGVYVRAAEFDLGSSRAEELREAFLKLKAKDKFILAHSQGFIASGPSAYRAIAAADEIWIQPGSSFEAPGITFETLFLGRALGKVNVDAEIEQFYEFKNAADVYKQSEYTPAHAESMTALADSVWSHSVADIAADRKSDPAAMRALLEASPYTADQAVEFKLADKLGWPEDAEKAATERAGDGNVVWIDDYAPPSHDGEAVIAIVGGEGEIITGGGAPTDLLNLGATAFASDRVAAELLALIDDEDVDAVIFRVDSPGGSATASDQVWRAVERLQESGKKVVVSMGALAASGGYYVATGADAIVAPRSTITGSIGVFGGKFAVADGLRMLGVDPDTVGVGGEFASAYSTEPFTETQRSDLREALGAVYARFTTLVSEGRKLPIERVQEIAKGRVWSGEDAKEIGLVDVNGGLMVAVDKAKELAGIAAADRPQLRYRKNTTSPLDLIMNNLASAGAVSPSQRAAMEMLKAAVGEKRAVMLLRQVRMIGETRGAQVWTPPILER